MNQKLLDSSFNLHPSGSGKLKGMGAADKINILIVDDLPEKLLVLESIL
jgi:hypothetical protein